MTVEMRPRGIPVGVVPQLYGIARDGDPLSLQAAQALLNCGGGPVAVLTGAIVVDMPKGEIDGPIGAAVLANALQRCGIQAELIVPDEMLDVLVGVQDALDGDSVARADSGLTTTYEAAVSVERLGRNRKGVIHTLFGGAVDPLPPGAFSPDDFIESLNQHGKLTIGIGDGGNEIGFGKIFDEARRVVPLGSDCACPCQDGLVTSTATQIVYPVAISNYGAYGIATALGILTEQPDLLPTAETVADAMYAAVQRGCMDGGTLDPTVPGDDGTPLEGVMAVITLLRTIGTQHFRTMPPHALPSPVYLD